MQILKTYFCTYVNICNIPILKYTPVMENWLENAKYVFARRFVFLPTQNSYW